LSTAAVPSDHDIILALGDDLPVAIWIARVPNGELVYANRKFGEIMGQSGRGDVHAGEWSQPYGILTRDGKPYPEDRMPFVRAIRDRQVVVADDITIRRPDGGKADVRAYARPVSNGDGVMTHVVIVFFDVTREVEAEKRLQRSQRMESIGTLAGGIAHDFNNLIFGIKLIAAELATSEANPDRKHSLALIDDIAERATMLTRSLLGFAKRGPQRAVPIAVDDVIAGMREMLSRTLAGITIEFELRAENRGTVLGDQSQLEQLVMNVVVNARDAIGEGGHVRVATRTVELDGPPAQALGVIKPGKHVAIEIADDGPGIPDEIRDRVFEPYFTTKDQGADRGTGLGLATVLGIVESHSGGVELDHGIGGRGTTVRALIPQADVIAARPESRGRSAAAPRGTGQVLVVDDDAMVRTALRGALAGLGYTPLEAASGKEALAMYEQHGSGIRAVVLDMVMPQMSGRVTFEKLRALDPKACVVVMSGYAMSDEVEAMLALGASGFVTKPYSAETLGRVLATACAHR
jgi:two-component system cell cycle sensor histidine kinase/response regulator CckA